MELVRCDTCGEQYCGCGYEVDLLKLELDSLVAQSEIDRTLSE